MENLKKLEVITLVDMLDEHTREYLKLLKDTGTKEEYEESKSMVDRLTAEIDSRKQKEMLKYLSSRNA